MSAYRTQIPLLTHEEKGKWMSMLTALRQVVIGRFSTGTLERLTNFWLLTEHGKMFRDGRSAGRATQIARLQSR